MEIIDMNEMELEKYVTRLMLEVGIPAHLRGYHYLRDAILLSGMDMESVSSVTKLLYPIIAKQNRTSGPKVERAIRNAIEVSWERGNEKTLASLFGREAIGGLIRPTNSEYIARLADKIRMDVKGM